MGKMIDLKNRKFGRLVALELTERRGKNKSIIWRCVCDCGNERYVTSNNLKSGNSQSCGCLQQEKAKKRLIKHGMCGTTEYEIWCGIIRRCYNPNCQRYVDYGGRGIFVCEYWRNSFENFFADMGERPLGKSLDRWPDYNGGYEPRNCRWATPHEQRINSRPKSYGPQKQRWFRAWHKDSMAQHMSINQSEFARKWGLTSQHISNCLNDKQKTHKGWTFERLIPREAYVNG